MGPSLIKDGHLQGTLVNQYLIGRIWGPKLYWRSHLIGDTDLILALSVDLDTALERE